jgi:hypothetical protein
MAALRFAPLFALPVLGGVLLAFVIATFQDDPDPVAETVTATDDQLEEQPEAIVEPTVEPEEEAPVVADEPEPEPPDPQDDFELDLNELFSIEDLGQYWRDSLPPALADLFENGFGGPRN